MTPSEGSISRWLGALKGGDHEAAQRLWEHYFRRLVGLARKRLEGAPRRAADEEDVALSAFDSFCRNAEAGRFPQLFDRESLWRLLVVITARKAGHQVRDEHRQKRGGGAVVQTEGGSGAEEISLLEQVLSREPTPEQAAQVAEEYRRLLALLRDRELEQVVAWRMEELTVEEIADKLGIAPRSVKRKLQLIRSIWENEIRT